VHARDVHGSGAGLPAKRHRARKLKQAGAAKKKQFSFFPCVKDATQKGNKAKLRKVGCPPFCWVC
jgi:hypothetical protein